MSRTMVLMLIVLLMLPTSVTAQTREEKVRDDRKKVEADGYWIYNDLARGVAEAKQSGKPMLVILRCIPCDECVKLDDDLVNQDKRVRPLLDQFVRVRLVSANGLDLSLFQFDTDQSFAGFLLNGDGTIYGRFGTRSHRTTWAGDVSIEGLAKALQGALELHQQYPRNKDLLARKKGPAPEFATPERYPSLKGKYSQTLNYEGKVVPSCIHCHQIGDARRDLLRSQGSPFSDQLLFPYPHPKSQGLILDPKERATVLRVEKGTPAEHAGVRAGDVILRLEGQPLLSLADVQWVLHHAPGDGAALTAAVQRGGRQTELTLTLPKGWRQHDDITWRSSTWGLRRMATGGMILHDLPPDERLRTGIEPGGMALQAGHVGQYGPHAAAQNAGFRKGDVLVSFDGRTDLRREADLFVHALNQRKVGDRVPVTILRGEKRMDLVLPIQP